MLFDAVQDSVALISIIFPHAVDMFLKITFTEETGQCVLFEIRHSAGIKSQFFLESAHEVRRQNHVADTNGRGETFREGVDINDFFDGVDTLQCGKRPAAETKFAVVVIFYDVAVFGGRGPVQQLVTAADRRYDACWEVMRR